MTDDEIDAIYIEHRGDGGPTAMCENFARAIIAAHTAKLLAGVEMPEPVGHLDSDTDQLAEFLSNGLREAHYKRGSYTPAAYTVPVYTADQLQQYAAPAAQPLSDEQILALEVAHGNDLFDDRDVIAFARAIEAAHGIGVQK